MCIRPRKKIGKQKCGVRLFVENIPFVFAQLVEVWETILMKVIMKIRIYI